MAGPLTIQRFPKGLIDLLGMRATGDTPNSLAQQIAGELALKDEYLYDRLVGRRTGPAVNVSAVGFFELLNVAVPAGTLRYLYGMGFETSGAAAATTLTLNCCISRGSLNVRNIFGPAQSVPVGLTTAFGVWFENPVLCGPTDSFGVFASQVTGAPNVAVTGCLWYADVGI